MQAILSAFAPALGRLGGMFKKFGNTASTAFSTIGPLAGVMALAIVGAMAAIAAAFGTAIFAIKKYIDLLKEATKIGMQFERSMILVSIITKQTTDDLKEMALGVAAFGVSGVQAAKGLETLARAGLESRELTALFGELTLFSRAFGVTMSKSAQLTINAMRAYGMGVEKASDITQAFAFAIVKTTFDFQTFSTAWAFASAAAAGFNRDLKGTVVMMGLFKDAGLRASTVGTTIRNMLTRLAKPTKEARGEMARLGINLDGIIDKGNDWAAVLRRLAPLQHDLAAATSLFGRRTAGFIVNLLRSMNKVTKEGTLFQQKMNELNTSGDIIRNAIIKRLNTATGQIEAAQAAVTNFKLEFFEINKPVIKEFFVEVNQVLAKMTKQMKELAPQIRFFTRILIVMGKTVLSVAKAFFVLGKAFFEVITFGRRMSDATDGLDGMAKSSDSIFTTAGSLISRITGVTGVVSGLVKGLIPAGIGLDDFRGALDEITKESAKTSGAFMALQRELSGKEWVPEFAVDEAQIQLMINKVKDALKKAGLGKDVADEMVKDMTPDKVQLSKFAGDLIISLQDGLKGNSKKLVKTMREITEVFGPELRDKFMDAAQAFSASGEAGKDMRATIVKLWRNINSDLATQKFELGPLFGYTPKGRKKVLMGISSLTLEMQNKILEMAKAGDPGDILLKSMIGDKKVTPAEKNYLAKKLASLLETIVGMDVQQDLGPFAGADFITDEEVMKTFIDGLKVLGKEVETVGGKFEKLDQVSKDIESTWSLFNESLGMEVLDSLKNVKDTMPFADFQKLNAEMLKAANKANTVKSQFSQLGDALANKFSQDIALAAQNLEPEAIEQTVFKFKEMFKVFKEAKNATKAVGEGSKFMGEGLEELSMKLSGMAIPDMIAYLQKMRDAALATKTARQKSKEWVESLGELSPQVKAIIQSWLDKLKLVPEEQRRSIEGMNAQQMKLIEMFKNVDKKNKELADAWRERMIKIGHFGAQFQTKFFQLMKGVADSVGRSLVDKTFDFRDAMRKMIKDIIASIISLIIQLMILKPLLTSLFPGKGAAGLFKKVFGFQTGTSMRGVAGPTGADNVPARLTKGEIVLDNSASDVFRQLVASGGGIGGTNMTFNINAIDGQSVKRVTRREIIPEINNGLRSNTGISAATSIRANRLNRRRSR